MLFHPGKRFRPDIPLDHRNSDQAVGRYVGTRPGTHPKRQLGKVQLGGVLPRESI